MDGFQATHEIRSITDSAAFAMAAYVRDHFRDKFEPEEPYRGCFVVLDVHGEILVMTSMGGCAPRHRKIALRKARTALHLQDDTVSIKKMSEAEVRGHGKSIETTFEGGVALFEDPNCQVFIGVSAFSGVRRSYQDSELVIESGQAVGVFAKDQPPHS